MPADDPRLLILVLALETDGRLKRVSRLLNPILYFVTGAVVIAVSSVLGI
jgi:type II secretory pathway component PulF